MTPDERRFDEVLLALRDMFMRAQGFSPSMLEDLIDPAVRRQPRTLNYLVASASGTLQDRYFTWVEAASYRPPLPPRPGLETGPALCDAEERLRRGRVSVRAEQLIRLERTMEAVLYVLQHTQEALARHVRRDAIPRLPEDAVPVLRFFSEYVRRAESELARYGLKAAV